MGPDDGRWLRCGRLFDARRRELAGPADVRVEHGRIVALRTPTGAREAADLDLRDCTLLPGLVDLDAEVLGESVSGDTGPWLYEALGRVRDLLQRGVTTARVLGGADPRWSLLDLRRAVADGLAPGCELMVAPHVIGSGVPVAGLGRAAERERRNGADWIAIDRRDLADAMPAVAAAAGTTPVAVSVASDDEAAAAIGAGARSLQVACPLTAPTARLARERDVCIVPRDGFGGVPGDVPLGFGGQLRGGLPELAERVGPAAALAAATLGGARCLRRRDGGVIEVGARADLVAVGGDPLAAPSRLADAIALVVAAGEVPA